MPKGNSLASLELQGRIYIALMWRKSERDKAFTDFYNLMYGYVYSVMSSQRINNKRLEEECIASLIADVFIKIYNVKIKPEFAHDAHIQPDDEENTKFSCLSWVKTITVRTFIDFTRKNESQSEEPQPVEGLLEQMMESETAVNLDVGSSDEDCITRVMTRLLKNYPKDFELLGWVVEGYMMKEIGKKLNISENTVNQRCKKARERANALRKKHC